MKGYLRLLVVSVVAIIFLLGLLTPISLTYTLLMSIILVSIALILLGNRSQGEEINRFNFIVIL
jgi:hypothetical protein